MKHAASTPSLDPTPPTPPLNVWNVYSADRHLVATYSTQSAAASHVACWPALYYSESVVTPTATTVVESTGTVVL